MLFVSRFDLLATELQAIIANIFAQNECNTFKIGNSKLEIFSCILQIKRGFDENWQNQI